jgi:PhnB protein
MTKREAVFSKDLENKKLTIVREFDAPLDLVWEAWTTAEILDQWWAPKPFHAETRTMDFRVGGKWLYAMMGPEGLAAWCRVDFTVIEPQDRFAVRNMFCDENGVPNPAFPVMDWDNRFSQAEGVTTVRVELRFEKEADMEMIIQMGFKEGFAAGLGNLDEYLQSRVPA